ncbi:MAG: serine/threonine protein kinase [Myxococcales bacterium]|nr:serine/threonine protein kinase [Myxococcales bacterium]
MDPNIQGGARAAIERVSQPLGTEQESGGQDSVESLGESVDESQRIEGSLHGLFRSDIVRPREVTLAALLPIDPVLPTDAFVLPASTYSPAEVLTAAPPVTPEMRPKSIASLARRKKKATDKTRPRTAVAPVETDLPGVGAIIDKYRIEELLGTGGFAAVFRATHLLLHMPVALKLLRSKVVRKNPELADRLCEEARFAAKINHPNVVRVFDVTHTKNITYVVMEYIEGRTLSKAISSDGPLPPAALLRVALDVAVGLKAGLAQGLIHRDIKPANIMLAKDGMTKIVDLGLATPTTIDPSSLDRVRRTVVGTRGYMAPEAVSQPDKVDFRVDVYALGVTMLHGATGKPPFSTERDRTTGRKARYEPVTIPDTIPGYAHEFVDVVRWMLDQEAGKRPATYDLLIDRLRSLQAKLGS